MKKKENYKLTKIWMRRKRNLYKILVKLISFVHKLKTKNEICHRFSVQLSCIRYFRLVRC